MNMHDKLYMQRNTSIEEVDARTLAEITQVTVDPALTVEERLSAFVRETQNPYIFKVHGTVVRVQYGDASISLQEKLLHIAAQ